jgi:hypothetical protein
MKTHSVILELFLAYRHTSPAIKADVVIMHAHALMANGVIIALPDDFGHPSH